MRWGKFLTPDKILPIWAGLCVGRADGSDAQYPAGQKHAILAMVRARDSDARNAICSLVHSKGWSHAELRVLKLLNEPFHSDDPVMLACYEKAATKQGGVVVYSAAIEED